MENQNQGNIKKIWKKEYFNRQRAKWVLENHKKVKLREISDPTYDPYEGVLNVCRKVLNNKSGVINQCYIQKDNIGRFNLAGGKFGAQNLMREFRTLLCCKDYYDIDIKNCHPTLLLQYAKKKNLDCKALEDYVKNRDKYFKEGSKLKLDKQEVKDLFLFIMFGGSGDKEVKKKIEGTDFEKKFKTYLEEVKTIQKYIYTNEQNIKQLVDEKEKENKNGSACSYYLQNEENKIVQIADDYFTKLRYHVGSLIFDGLQVRKTKELGTQVLTDLNKLVKTKTEYEIEFIIKDWDKDYDIPEHELNFNIDLYLVDNDREAAEIMIDLLEGIFIKSGGSFYEKKSATANIYIPIDEKTLKTRLLKYVTDVNIQKRGEKQNTHMSKNNKSAKNIIDVVVSLLVEGEDQTLKHKLDNSTKHKLCFLNGYYDFLKKEFCEYNDDIATAVFVNRNYKEPKEEKMNILKNKILYPILTDEKQRKWYLNWLSRGIAGLWKEDKTYVIGVGNRDSGKSAITDLCKNAFNTYARTFNGEQLACSKLGGDLDLKLKWLSDFEYCRLLFSNELKSEDENKKQLKLDGEILKRIASGGDEIQSRKIYQDAKEFSLKARMCLFMNRIPTISTDEAKETLSVIEFSSIFKDEITEEEKKINEIQEKGGCKFYLKDKSVKTLVMDEEICDAWVHLLIEHFYIQVPEHYKENMEDLVDNKNDDEKLITETLEFTFNKEDKISNSELKEMFSDMNISKLALTLKKKGAIPYKSGSTRGYCMIKLKENKE